MAQFIKNRFVRVALWAALSLFLLLLSVIGAVQFPYVQTKAVNYLSEKLSEKTGYTIRLAHLSVWWFDSITIEDILIADPEGNAMVEVSALEIDFELRSLLSKDNHHIDEITLENARVYFTKLPSDSVPTLNINDFIARINDLSTQKSTKKTALSCDELTIVHSRFEYNDPFKEAIPEGFDYHHFTLDSINGTMHNLYSADGTFGVQIKRLTTVDPQTKLRVAALRTDFSISPKAMLFDHLELHTNHSTVRDLVKFEYGSVADLSDFNNRVLINSRLENTVIDTRDLKHFAPALAHYNEKYRVSGNMNGRVNNFNFKNAEITFGSATTIRGKIRMTGLPVFQETFIDFNLENSFVTLADLRPYVQARTYEKLKPFSTVSFNAEFIGFPNDFVAVGDFFTEYGRINSDINLKLENDISRSAYSGNLSMSGFDLGGFTGNEAFGELELKGNIKGKGFSLETADFNLRGKVGTLGFKGYRYHNIITNARFAKELFEGSLSIDDEYLKLDVSGAVDLRHETKVFNIQARLDTADLQKLNLTKEPLALKTHLYVNSRGLDPDEALGTANLGSTFLHYGGQDLHIDTLSLLSDKDENQRTIWLKTNFADARINGEFDVTQVIGNLKMLLEEYKLSIRNDSEEMAAYYASKDAPTEDYKLDYSLYIKDIDPVMKVFAPTVTISGQTRITGSVVGGFTSIISLETRFDTLWINDNYFAGNELQVDISKISDSTNILAMIYLASGDQKLSAIDTKDLLIEGIWNNNHIDFEFDIYQQGFDNRALLRGGIDFKQDTIDLKLESADLNVLNKQWRVAEDNLITLSDRHIMVNHFSIFNNEQTLTLAGLISEDPKDILRLDLKNLQLNNLNTVLNKSFSGTTNGFAELRNYYKDILIESDLLVETFKIDSFMIGDLKARTHWDNATKSSEVQCNLRRLGFNIFDLTGTYSPNEASPLDLIADMNGTELKIAEPFLGDYFKDMEGKLNGQLKITGTPAKPVINGNGTIDGASVLIGYLKTRYSFNGGFYMNAGKIGFSNVVLTDPFGGAAILNGYIGHQYFNHLSMNLNAQLRNFNVLNTTAKDNTLFYGTGMASGTVDFTGPLSNMTIAANAKTEKGTRIFIPIGGSETVEQVEYISFVDFNAAEKIIKEKTESIDLRGIKLDFDLEVTTDAYYEIIFDIKAGDIIKGRGYGDIELQIDTKGEFAMFGDFNIVEGGYNFTMYNVINKEFEILPGSRISWYGDPYKGNLDIQARYKQLASLIPLLEGNSTEEFDLNDVQEVRRKYPVNVSMDIEGPLLSPDVGFDIATGSLPRNVLLPDGTTLDLEFEFLKFKSSIDEQELKRQVFSLIILRKFSPLQSFSTGGSITNSVSELFSNQLSYWITQVDENLEIDLDFGKLDEEAFNTFQLRLSYTFLDGRLRVTRDGGFTNQANEANVSSIAGDWTVEYLLTEDGKLKAKMYNRTNYNPINPTEENQNIVTTGFSVLYTQSFSELKDLFKKAKEKVEKEARTEQPETEVLLPADDSIN